MDTFGEWLRDQRNQLQLTREQFANRVGCSIALLRKIEDGERRPSAQIAGLMANCLNIPSAERSTFIKVARGELSVDRLAPVLKPIVSPTPPRISLPVLPTPLIGRQYEVDQLGTLLRDPECRMLTLVGPGGIGKTRLAIEAAAQAQEPFADGVYFVPLASVTSTRYIVPVIADAVGFTFQGTSRSDPKGQLFSFLREKKTLLLVDNLEHLLAEPGIEVLAELLVNVQQTKLLITSRESLGFQGEWVFEVQGLPIPDDKYVQGGAQNTSVELFLQRARRAHMGFDATPQDFTAIVRICQLVDGMPLGIELAATWVRTLACDEIAQEIERGLDFLSVSARDLPARHRSMRAVFDHSWKLLAEDEQRVLLRLAVFQGGFRREAAQAVAGATVSVLSTLMTKSLIRRSGTSRYDLHELIRQFAIEHLANRPEEQTLAQTRHGSYYLTVFSQADERLRSFAQRDALAELTTEMDNFRTAWDWAVAHSKFSLIEQTMRTFTMLYDTLGWLQEGLDMLGQALNTLETANQTIPPNRTDQLALGHILACRSVLASRLGRYDQAQAMLERSLEILRPLHELRVEVEAVTFLGTVMELSGNYARAFELYSEGLEIATSIGDRWFAALCDICLAGLAGITQMMVTPETTHERVRAAVANWRDIGDPRFTAIGLNVLGWSALTLGHYDEAQAALEESILLSLSVGDRWGSGFAYRGLGIVMQAQGEHLQAVKIFHESLDTLTDLGARQDVARVLAEMGRSLFALGNDAEAEGVWHEALRATFDVKGTFIALEAFVGLASLRRKQGELQDALELLLFVLGDPSILQDTKDRAARMQSELEAQLTGPQVEVVRARARAQTFETIYYSIIKP
jgi:predicted ATPase/transcriptional regulator with XRE-family HTH domain